MINEVMFKMSFFQYDLQKIKKSVRFNIKLPEMKKYSETYIKLCSELWL